MADADMQTSEEERVEYMQEKEEERKVAENDEASISNPISQSANVNVSSSSGPMKEAITSTNDQSIAGNDERSNKGEVSTTISSLSANPDEPFPVKAIDTLSSNDVEEHQTNLDISQSQKQNAEEVIEIPDVLPSSNESLEANGVDKALISGEDVTDTTKESENIVVDLQKEDDKEKHDEHVQLDNGEGSILVSTVPNPEKDTDKIDTDVNAGSRNAEKTAEEQEGQKALDELSTIQNGAGITSTSNKDVENNIVEESEKVTPAEKTSDEGPDKQVNEDLSALVSKDESLEAEKSDLEAAGDAPSSQFQHTNDRPEGPTSALAVEAQDASTEIIQADSKDLNKESIAEKVNEDQQTEKTTSQNIDQEAQSYSSDESVKIADNVQQQPENEPSAVATEPSEPQPSASALPSTSEKASENVTKLDSHPEVEGDDPLKIADHEIQPFAEAAQPGNSQQDPTTMTQIAILLKINKELIRLCIDLQGKELINDPIYKESAMRLQTNLAFLAAMAEPSGKSTKQTNATLNDEPFPITSATSDTLLPKLYAHLRSISTESTNSSKEADQNKESATEPNQDVNSSQQEDVMQKSSDQASSSLSPNIAGSKKRRRTSTSEQDAQSNRSAPGRSPSSNGTKPINRRKSSTSANNVATSALSTPTLAMPQAVPAVSSAAATDMAAHSPNPPLPNGSATGSNGSPAQGPSTVSPQPNGVRNGNPTPQQLQGLIQAFGQNAVNNLNALQSHYRSGQPQAVVAYMESNVPNFRNLPLQLQLQQMASVQNAAVQRQRQASIGSTVSNNAASPGAPGTPQQQQSGPSHQRRPSAAPSPGGDQLRRSTQSPMSAPNAPPFSQQASVNGIGQQHQQAPGTPVNMSMPFGNIASPATSAASPGTFGQNQSMQPFQQQQQQQSSSMHNQMGGSIQRANSANGNQQPGFNVPAQQIQQSQAPQQQPNMPTASQAQQMFASLPPQLSSLPAHLQQQLLQNLLMQQQQQQQQQQQPQMTSQPMAPPTGMNPMMAAMLGQAQQQSSPSGNFRPGSVGLNGNGSQSNGMPNLANMWANMQQQQQQQQQQNNSQ